MLREAQQTKDGPRKITQELSILRAPHAHKLTPLRIILARFTLINFLNCSTCGFLTLMGLDIVSITCGRETDETCVFGQCM